MAQAVRDETGLRTVFHHHCAGYVETPDEIARLMDLTDPDLLGLVFDTGHYAFGAGGCAGRGRWAERFADRIRYIHFKDCHPEVAARARGEGWDYFQSVGNGVFCELGQGCVDFPAVAALAGYASRAEVGDRGAGCAAGHGLAKGKRCTQPGVSAHDRAVARSG